MMSKDTAMTRIFSSHASTLAEKLQFSPASLENLQVSRF
jgi:hypothetical protein